ncbi:GntR family transcriptional regulator [Kineococcus rubinsiae]|uniref:GntR family transcriptional regulator n=1 Tax=Kineococcus rubinsiae TaxID=2609562 RepID=UPI001AD8BB66|nr:GntR family transcriptional regulator [Kineococcus rubinsiae]
MTRERSGRLPLADKMYGVLLEEFLDGTRVPGDDLNIATLSRELDVSQTPLREALARLEHTGLVRREALKGYRVAPLPSEDEVRQLLDARLVLEPPLTVAAGRRASGDFLHDLQRSVDVLVLASSAVQDRRTAREWWTADETFHTLLARRSGNTFLADAYAALGGQLQRVRVAAGAPALDPHHSAVEHQQILDALVDGDADRGGELMRNHLEQVRRRTLGRGPRSLGAVVPDAES